jgi:3-dehydroquinate synthase
MIIITNNIASELQAYLSAHKHDTVFVLADTNTAEKCLPLLDTALADSQYTLITIEAGDIHKDIRQVCAVWDALSRSGASRHSLLINVGGGMVTDLGGFAGATFKRGLHTLNIPTTLMASVDAASGGKTGINYNGLKNEIGAFHTPDCVMIDCTFLKTSDRDNLLSGFAEMIKHGLISDRKTYFDTLAFDIEHPDMEGLTELVKASVAIKERIVKEDFTETGIRKALNFGHTVGHAFESLSIARNRPLLHGHAVAAGMVCELYLSHKTCDMPVDMLRQVTNFVKTHYPPFVFTCDDYETVYELMTHDKKNEDSRIRFTLLGNIGDVLINQEVSKSITLQSFDFYRESM